jgi:hypothetical protein
MDLANPVAPILVRMLPAVGECVAPLFAPMERAAMGVLSSYRDDELALLLDFLTRARDAALTAMSELRALPEPRSKKPKLRKPR